MGANYVYGLLHHVNLIDFDRWHHEGTGAVVYPSSKWRGHPPGHHGIRGCGADRSSDLEGQNSYRPFRTAAEPLVSLI